MFHFSVLVGDAVLRPGGTLGSVCALGTGGGGIDGESGLGRGRSCSNPVMPLAAF